MFRHLQHPYTPWYHCPRRYRIISLPTGRIIMPSWPSMTSHCGLPHAQLLQRPGFPPVWDSTFVCTPIITHLKAPWTDLRRCGRGRRRLSTPHIAASTRRSLYRQTPCSVTSSNPIRCIEPCLRPRPFHDCHTSIRLSTADPMNRRTSP